MNASCFRAACRALPCTVPVAALAAICAVCALPVSANAQQAYRNIINQKFRAVSNGPQSAIIVDVKNPADLDAVHAAIRAKIRAVRSARYRAFGRGARFQPTRRGRRTGEILTYVDTVFLSQNGKPLAPTRSVRTRDVPAGNNLNFVLSTAADTSFTGAKANRVAAVSAALKTELTALLGQPLGNGTVTILNKDDDANDLNAASTIRGATVVVLPSPGTTTVDPNNLNIEIHLPQFNSDSGSFQDSFLGLAQTMAQCYHLPYYSNDAFEQGMARASASIVTQGLRSRGAVIGDLAIQTIDPVPGFYYTPYYDLQNQPALGNNTFFPPTSVKQNFNTTATMIAPRLQMAGTAWTKCYIENPGFFKSFNNAYYNAIAADPTTPNNMTALRTAVSQALPAGTVEGTPFDVWFEQQYVLDTSVTPGPKIYAFASPTSPDTTISAGAGIGVYYYATDKSGDETVLNATLTPTYYDHTYAQLPSLDNTQAVEAITNGAASASPIFTGLDPQRITIDLLVSSSQPSSAHPGGNEYARLYFPAGEETYTPASKPSDFSGVLVGAQAADFVVSFNGGGGALTTTTAGTGGVFGTGNGAFGGEDPSNLIPTGFTKATIIVTPTAGTVAGPVTFQRNVYVRKDDTTNGLFGVSPIWVLNTGANQTTTTNLSSHTFNAGPQMVSLPLQPYAPFTSNLPLLFTQGTTTPDPNAQLIAQYRQDADATTGKYVRYPSLPPYQPGLAFWTNFAGAVNRVNFTNTGETADNKNNITVPLQFGWNMIGNPYTSDLTFDPTSADTGIYIQYQNGDVLALNDAVTAGYVATGIFGYNNAGGYQDITTSSPTGGLTQNLIQTWSGYWLRVTVTEGVTISYINPKPDTSRGAKRIGGNSLRSRSLHTASRASEVGGWRLPLVVRDGAGSMSGAILGQSPRGADSFVPALDASSPPPFSRNATLGVRFPHPEWDAAKSATDGNQYLSDIRHTGAKATWDVNVSTPIAEQPYVLTWQNMTSLPRGMRLTLVDMETNTRHAMNQGASYTFTPARGATARRFQVLAEPRTAGRLFITNAHVDAHVSRGTAGAASIFYEVSGASDTTIEVRTASGRVIRHIAQGRAASAGVNQATWDYRDDTGRGLATGVYMIYITARTPEGETARTIVTHAITR